MLFHSFLLIDAGNTRTKLATAPIPGSGLPPRALERKSEFATAAVTEAALRALREKYRGHFLVFSSVVPRVTSALLRVFKRGVHRLAAGDSPLGFGFDYPKPAELGADRLAAAVAVHAEGHFPALIVQCGTATAFTVLDRRGRLGGGVIAPGLQAQLDALVGAAAQLPSTKLGPPASPLAKSTREALRAGVFLNFEGGAREIIARLAEALPGRKAVHVVLTGGDAPRLAGRLELRHQLRPLLVFEGLHIIGQRLVDAARL